MSSIVCKFGGTSVATSDQIRKIAAIVDANPDRKYIVVSAPGKRSPEDQKITDLFYLAAETSNKGIDATPIIDIIKQRFNDIIKGLDLDLSIENEINEISIQLKGANKDYAASRGEYLNAKIIASYLKAKFVDPTKNIFFSKDGTLIADKTYLSLKETMSENSRYVIPGFYGISDSTAEVVTFSRGGSDITGAIVARAVEADLYENWTDVDGLLMTDPRIVDNPLPIPEVSYKELRELSYMGAQVLHDEAIFPVRELGIPVHIKNTNSPDSKGTRIVDQAEHRAVPIVGIAGKEDFEAFYVHKALMNKELGFGRKLLEIFETHGVSFEHFPSGIDTVSVVVSTQEVENKRELILEDIKNQLKVDGVDSIRNLALIAVVGSGMAHHPGVAATLFSSMAAEGINIRLIDQGVSEITIIIGVEMKDFKASVRAIYQAFISTINSK
jgi:aspartate kinase